MKKWWAFFSKLIKIRKSKVSIVLRVGCKLRDPINGALSIHIHMSVTPFFQQATYYFFLMLCNSRYLQVMQPLFRGIFLCPKWINWAFWGQNTAFFNFPLNVFTRFIWNLLDYRYLKVGKSDHFKFLEKFFSEVTLLIFLLNLFNGFYEIVPDCHL